MWDYQRLYQNDNKCKKKYVYVRICIYIYICHLLTIGHKLLKLINVWFTLI